MKRIINFLSFMFISAHIAFAQVSNVNPVPHQAELGELITVIPQTTMGIVGEDRCVKKYRSLVPDKAEGYYLTIDRKGRVVIAARDAQGLFYGQQTLKQISKAGKLQVCTIRDWPDVTWRGVVEGFYGQPWSHEHRLRQLRFYGENKMNVYIYGPKDDPYHRDRWRDPYPETEARQIQELVSVANENHVKFYWAIHPGVDIKWNDDDRDNLVRKLEKMYDLGVRSFAVFFDDIWGEGAKGDKQAALLNYVDDHFVKEKGDVSPLVLCPTEYNRAWSSDNSEYLHSLGSSMHPDIEVMWTGNSVVHCIDKESMEWINKRIQRKAYIWWNFPVSDYVRDHMLLGPSYGNGLDIADDLSGFVSNPMQYAESSKLALYGVADYTWNMYAYQYDVTWEKALKELMPQSHNALRTFASYNEDLGPNGHGFRREESRSIVQLAQEARSGDKAAISLLKNKCNELHEACQTLLESSDNPWLVAELRPWLIQAQNVAEYGNLICSMGIDGSLVNKNTYDEVKDISKKMYNLEGDKNILHPYQTGIKTATRVFMPTLNSIFEAAITQYNKRTGCNLDPNAEYLPMRMSSTVPQLAMQPLTLRGKEVRITPSNEVVKWPVGSNMIIDCEEAITIQGLDFNFGQAGIAGLFSLEVKDPDGQWHDVSLLHYNDTEETVHTGNEIADAKAKSIRLTNVSGKELKLYLRSFRVEQR